MNPNVRKENESFEKYQQRRKTQNIADKERAKGRLIWNSSLRGTYIRKRDGAI